MNFFSMNILKPHYWNLNYNFNSLESNVLHIKKRLNNKLKPKKKKKKSWFDYAVEYNKPITLL